MWRFAHTYYNNVEKGRVVRGKRVKLSAFSWEGWFFALLLYGGFRGGEGVQRSPEGGGIYMRGVV